MHLLRSRDTVEKGRPVVEVGDIWGKSIGDGLTDSEDYDYLHPRIRTNLHCQSRFSARLLARQSLPYILLTQIVIIQGLHYPSITGQPPMPR